MGIVVDTSGYSAADRNDRSVRHILSEADQIFLPVTVVGELLYGFYKGNRTSENQVRLQRFADSSRVTLVPIGVEIAEQYAKIKFEQQTSGYTIAENDLWIAAVAVELGLPILTLDSDFNQITGVELVDLK